MKQMGSNPRQQHADRLHVLFEQQAARTPDAPALFDERETLTYRELAQRADRLAHDLASRGAAPGQRIAICLPRSARLLTAVLAVRKTGAAFVPLDVSLPLARARAILEDADPKLLILERGDEDIRSVFAGEAVVVGDDVAGPAVLPEALQPAEADHVLAVLYTSGVTGRPKGVVVTDRAILTHMRWMWETFPFRPADVAVSHRSLMLISSSWDYFGPLLAGVPSVILSEHTTRESGAVFERLAAHRVSHVSGSPPFWDAILDQVERHPTAWSSLRVATISGEQVTARIVRRWNRAFPSGRLLNVYGATECVRPAVHDTSRLAADAERVPIGTPLPGVWMGVLDEALRPVPDGETGELCVAGPCLAEGYLNLPELTRERFVQRADAGTGHDVLYRTGDVGRRRVDGAFELVGRRDHQVKIRGNRVELGDVQAALLQYAPVKQAAVGAQDDPRGGKRLVAYFVTEQQPPPSAADLRRLLAASLPDYMIPSFFVAMDRLPLTHSGKTDWSALPAPGITATGPANVEELTDTERSLARIWADIFNRPHVGADDDFFDLGGHSLIAMQIASRVVDVFGVELPMDVLFSTPTLRAVAAGVDTARAKATGVPGASVGPASASIAT